jgi:hypothetical protein
MHFCNSGRVKFTDYLHVFDLGLVKASFLWLWALIASFGYIFLSAHSARVGAQPGFYNGIAHDTKFVFAGYTHLKMSGVPGSQYESLLILCLASVSVSPDLFPSKARLHRYVIRALEDIIILSMLAAQQQISAEGVDRFETLASSFIVNCTRAFQTVFKTGEINRPKLGSLSHYVNAVSVDGTSVMFNCSATESAGKDVKFAYARGNKKGEKQDNVASQSCLREPILKLHFKSPTLGDVGGWMMSFLGLRYFIRSWLPVLLRQKDREEEETDQRSTFYQTRIRQPVSSPNLLHNYSRLSELKSAALHWASEHPGAVPPHHVFDIERCFSKDRARICIPDVLNSYVVATDDYRLGRGDGMAASASRARYDFVELAGLQGNSTAQLCLIFTYKWHDRALGSIRSQETDFIFVQHMTDPIESPYRVFDFCRMVDTFSVMGLSSIVRNRWVLTNFRSSPVPALIAGRKSTVDYLIDDGFLVWKY